MKMWMFNCKEISELVSQSMDQDLSLTKRMGVRFHLMMCRYCARFGQQLKRIRELMHTQEENNIPPLVMDNKVKATLNGLIQQRKKS